MHPCLRVRPFPPVFWGCGCAAARQQQTDYRLPPVKCILLTLHTYISTLLYSAVARGPTSNQTNEAQCWSLGQFLSEPPPPPSPPSPSISSKKAFFSLSVHTSVLRRRTYGIHHPISQVSGLFLPRYLHRQFTTHPRSVHTYFFSSLFTHKPWPWIRLSSPR